MHWMSCNAGTPVAAWCRQRYGDETAAGVARGLNALRRVDDLFATKAFSIVSLTAPERVRYRELRQSLA